MSRSRVGRLLHNPDIQGGVEVDGESVSSSTTNAPGVRVPVRGTVHIESSREVVGVNVSSSDSESLRLPERVPVCRFLVLDSN